VARYGGEEFVVLLPGTATPSATQIAQRICAAVEALGIEHGASPVSPVVTISAGVASCVPAPDGNSSALLEAADHMLYQAKQSGRNQVQSASPATL
jgi:diguanylate cyclase (GGDEF)-like protein